MFVYNMLLIMAALWNRTGHYILAHILVLFTIQLGVPHGFVYAEYRDASFYSHVRQSSVHAVSSSTASITAAVTKHWAAIHYESGKGKSCLTLSLAFTRCISEHICFYRTQVRLFLALSVITLFFCHSNRPILGTNGSADFCANFTKKTCLVPRWDEFECQGQRSTSPGRAVNCHHPQQQQNGTR